MKKTGNAGSRNTGIARTGVRSVGPYSNDYTRSQVQEPAPAYSGSYTSYRSRVRQKRQKKLKKLAVIAAAAVLVVTFIVLLAAGVFQKRYEVTLADGSVVKMTRKELIADLTVDVFPEGIIINGINVSGMTKDEALAAIKANQPERPLEINVTLTLDGQEYPVDLSSLPIEVNDVEVVDKAFKSLIPTGEETPEELVAMFVAREALKDTPATYQTAYTPNTEDISTQVHGVLDALDREAVDAVITGFNVQTCQFEYTDSQSGYDIDIDTAVSDVKALLDGGTYVGTVAVNADITEPSLTSSMIQNEFGLISSTSSSTSTSNASRANNVATAASSINGLIIPAGGSFSFNGTVGERTAANGYQEAGVIIDGATEQGFGGGVCQVSTMVYESAVKADLQINERHPHQWPAKYADDGCDAAVDWGSQDLRFTNTSGYPIVISAYHDSSAMRITVAIYGHKLDNGEYITFTGDSVDTVEYQTTYVQNTEMHVGETNTTRTGHNAKTATSYKVRYDANGNEISRETFTTYYNVINEEIEVGTLQDDGTQASFDPTTGSVTVSETTESTDYYIEEDPSGEWEWEEDEYTDDEWDESCEYTDDT
ncbi:MAG: VanW family protein [Saccharofermentans sp.]|nr:VanW family protein [Saccharofermentans sp.]